MSRSFFALGPAHIPFRFGAWVNNWLEYIYVVFVAVLMFQEIHAAYVDRPSWQQAHANKYARCRTGYMLWHRWAKQLFVQLREKVPEQRQDSASTHPKEAEKVELFNGQTRLDPTPREASLRGATEYADEIKGEEAILGPGSQSETETERTSGSSPAEQGHPSLDREADWASLAEGKASLSVDPDTVHLSHELAFIQPPMFSKAGAWVLLRIRPSLGLRPWTPPASGEAQGDVAALCQQAFIEVPRDRSHVVRRRYDDGKTRDYSFDHVFPPSASTGEVFQCVKALLESYAVQGHNGALILDGYSGTGKTYTMSHGNDCLLSHIGQRLFDLKGIVEEEGLECDIRCSIQEAYNGKARDLLNKGRELLVKGPKRDACAVVNVASAAHLADLFRGAARIRKIDGTANNPRSSRGHLVAKLTFSKRKVGTETDSHLLLIDLAGAERLDTDESLQRQQITQAINKSREEFRTKLNTYLGSKTQTASGARYMVGVSRSRSQGLADRIR